MPWCWQKQTQQPTHLRRPAGTADPGAESASTALSQVRSRGLQPPTPCPFSRRVERSTLLRSGPDAHRPQAPRARQDSPAYAGSTSGIRPRHSRYTEARRSPWSAPPPRHGPASPWRDHLQADGSPDGVRESRPIGSAPLRSKSARPRTASTVEFEQQQLRTLSHQRETQSPRSRPRPGSTHRVATGRQASTPVQRSRPQTGAHAAPSRSSPPLPVPVRAHRNRASRGTEWLAIRRGNSSRLAARPVRTRLGTDATHTDWRTSPAQKPPEPQREKPQADAALTDGSNGLPEPPQSPQPGRQGRRRTGCVS